MKRIITLLVAIVFAYQLQAQNSEYDFFIDNLYYKILTETDKEVEVVQNPTPCYFYTGRITIPDSVEYMNNYYKVVSLGKSAFSSARGLDIRFPNVLRSIGESCFLGANLQSILILPESLEYIGYQAFLGIYNVSTVYIPASVNHIEVRAFAMCPHLENIIVDSNNTYYTSVDGLLYTKDTTKLLQCPMPRIGTLTVLDGVEYIETCAFEKCALTDVILPSTLRVIKNSAFTECENLFRVHIPAGVTAIEGGAFRGCKRLQNLTVDSLNNNYIVVDSALYSINMDTLLSHPLAHDTVRVPSTVKIVAVDAFSVTSKLKYVYLPEGVTELHGAFMGSNIRGISLPQTLTMIGENAFYNSKLLYSIEIPNSVKEIGRNAFFQCRALKSVVMSDSVKTIPAEAFMYCTNLNSYSGGASVERIEECAFSDCSNLSRKIIFPNTLKVIESFAFFATALTEIEFTGMVDTIEAYSFESLQEVILVNPIPPYSNNKIANSCGKVIIPCNATQAYMSDPNWNSFNLVEDCDGIEDADPQSAVQVVVQHNSIDVYNAENYSVAIYDVMGRCHAAEPATGQSLRHYSLPTAGVYVVHINGKGYKVVVR